jgi:uncharacterized membrane protein
MKLSQTQQQTIEAKIAEIESKTSGEIKVIIAKSSSCWRYGNRAVQNKAMHLFRKYGLHKTIDKTGVLIFFSIKERQFYIYADQGIYQKIGQDTLNDYTRQLGQKMQEGLYCEGIMEILEHIANLLCQYFPIKENDTNELDNKIIMIR